MGGAGSRVLQRRREAGGIPGLDRRHCGEGTEDGAHHRQAQGDRGAGQGEGGRTLVETVKGQLRNATIPYTIFSVLSVGRSTDFIFPYTPHFRPPYFDFMYIANFRHFSKIDYLYHRRLLWIVSNAVITG